jgi:AP-3 complex subunit beta
MDPPFTRLIKIDILTSLALEPAAIEAVLKELRTCIRHTDKVFVCAAIRAVGKVAELARIVYDRHGTKSGHAAKERKTANRIALDCLHGLSVITQSCDIQVVVGECVTVMQNILVMLMSDAGGHAGLKALEDPNDVQGFALRRIMLLLVRTLSLRTKEAEEEDEDENGSDDEEAPEESALDKISIELPPGAVSSALWLVGEWLSMLSLSPVTLRNVDGTVRSKMRLEIARLVDRAFPDLDPLEKEQGIHFASKLLISSASGAASALVPENAICEHILSMGRVDVNPDVRDRARYESGVLQATIGLKHDTDATESLPALGSNMTLENAKRIFLLTKPAPSYLPVEDNETVDTNSFRFGTLSSLVGHKARGAYLDLPPWGESNSPKALRDPIVAVKEQAGSGWKSQQQSASGFYKGEGPSSSDSDSDTDSDDSSSSDSSSSESGNQQDSASDGNDDDSSSGNDSSSNDNNDNLMNSAIQAGAAIPPMNGGSRVPPMNGGHHDFFSGQTMQPMAPIPAPEQVQVASQLSSDESSSSDSSSSSSDSSDSDAAPASGNSGSGNPGATEGNFLSTGGGGNGGNGGGGDTLLSQHNAFGPSTSSSVSNVSSSALDDLRGLVMAPVAVEDTKAADPDFDRDSSAWIQLVRPELCGGLAVKARYLRGPTKTREAQLKGLDPNSPSVVCLQIQFGNK